MAYFLVMGSLALSVAFSVGWLLVRSGQWLSARLAGGGKPRRSRRVSATPPRRAPASRARAGTASKSKAQVKRQPQTKSGPWPLTRWLAARRFALPLSLLAALLYGFTRLAEYGMAARPHEAPGAFHDLVAFLGWSAAGLAGLAVIQLMASWRCRGG
jgi:hypothetical protein